MGLLFDKLWKESIRTTTQASFSMENSRAKLVGHIDADYESSDLLGTTDAQREILGSAEPAGDGKIKRGLPLAHPEFPWLFASSINVQGLSFYDKHESEANFEAPPLKEYARYNAYQYEIEFQNRPYLLFQDKNINTGTITYYKSDGTAVNNKKIAYEWYRYTDYEEVPSAEYLTAQQGQFVFETSDASEPDGNTVPGQLRLLQQKSTVKFRWYQVPYSYINSYASYIKAAQGHINQFDWYGWPKGTLLYNSFTYKRYTPPNPQQYDYNFGDTTKKVIGNEKLVDIEFVFIYFDPGEPGGGAAPAAPTNQSHITNGHNLLPWLAAGGGIYFYAKSAASVAPNKPLYPSYPFELLFTDPDVV